jgi:hypothetical protein
MRSRSAARSGQNTFGEKKEMDKLTAVLASLAVLSLATERITEAIKGLPFLNKLLATEQQEKSKEEIRKAAIHILAIAVGTTLAYMTRDQLSTALGIKFDSFLICLVYGAMASGGSGFWNSVLDVARQFNKQKQLVTEELKKRAV